MSHRLCYVYDLNNCRVTSNGWLDADLFVRQIQELKGVLQQGAVFHVLEAGTTSAYCSEQFKAFVQTVPNGGTVSIKFNATQDDSMFYGVLGLFCGLVLGIVIGSSSSKKS